MEENIGHAPGAGDPPEDRAAEPIETPHRFSFMGLGGSGCRNTASRIKEILAEEWGHHEPHENP